MKRQMDSPLKLEFDFKTQAVHERNDMKKLEKGSTRKGWWARFIERLTEANKNSAAAGCSR